MTHLADLIQEEMKERGWDLDALVMNMGPFYSERDYGICKLSWEMFFAVRGTGIILGDQMAQQLSNALSIEGEIMKAELATPDPKETQR